MNAQRKAQGYFRAARSGAMCALATVPAIDVRTALQTAREERIRSMHEERSFCEMYLKFLLARSTRTQAGPADQLFPQENRVVFFCKILIIQYLKTRFCDFISL